MDRLTEKAILDSLSKEKHKETKKEEKPATSSKGLLIAISIVIIFTVLLGVLIAHKETVYAGKVHWVAKVNVSICGEEIDLCEQCGADKYYYKNHTLHILGPIKQKEDIQLSKFFEAANLTFNENQIMNNTNGDQCNGKPAMITMTVNEQPREDYEKYIPYAAINPEKQHIRIKFE